MYAVIFRAELKEIDESYFETASRLRELAVTKYACAGFTSVNEGNKEISISYWNSKEQIMEWKQDGEHLAAQKLGREKWYKSYQIQVAAIVREYSS
jgi:heme-degrading monooxygenase HmoA